VLSRAYESNGVYNVEFGFKYDCSTSYRLRCDFVCAAFAMQRIAICDVEGFLPFNFAVRSRLDFDVQSLAIKLLEQTIQILVSLSH
jgi:hypothetical protein